MCIAVLKPYSTENTPKNAKKSNLLKSKRILKLKYKLNGGPVFTFSFAEDGNSLLCPASYATATNTPNIG